MSLGCFLHFLEDKSRNFLRMKLLSLSLIRHLNQGLIIFPFDDLERPMLHVRLHRRVVELPADQPLGIEDRVARISSGLALGCITH
mmetsp:Transcript_88443/g.140734  ORF Transcript_88443/g.140734 Transcript_88443/m.140734 type:complete len:86 (+) Transcript_88443:573-830(+)